MNLSFTDLFSNYFGIDSIISVIYAKKKYELEKVSNLKIIV